MATCDVCGRDENMPYNCRHCGGTFCAEHRLPEAHDCPGLEDWNDPSGVFDSGFDDSVQNRGGSSGVLSRLGIDSGTGGPLSYFRGNMTYVFLGLMFITFAFQYLLLPALGIAPNSGTWNAIFVISPEHPEYVWTWFTSIFAHSPTFTHILFNAIVIYFFGRLVEGYVGSRDFTLLFLGSGAIAGLAQIAYTASQGSTAGALGASGAGLAIMGVLTVLNPRMRVLLYFIVPVPIWVLTIAYALISVGSVFGIEIIPGVANIAHLVGLLIGLAYGQYAKGNTRPPDQVQFGGGGRMGGGPGGPGGGRGRF